MNHAKKGIDGNYIYAKRTGRGGLGAIYIYIYVCIGPYGYECDYTCWRYYVIRHMRYNIYVIAM